MFVNPESALQAFEMLEVLAKSLGEKQALSQLDSKIYEAVNDIRAVLRPKPFAPYTTIQEAVGNYVQYRDMLGIERKAWEDHESDVKDEMTRISMWLRDRGDELGVDCFNTPYGTAYRKTDNLQCVEKRAAKLAVKEIYDRDGVLPPGLNEFVEVEFNVRRPTKQKAC